MKNRWSKNLTNEKRACNSKPFFSVDPWSQFSVSAAFTVPSSAALSM
jgi:hypothetical protein